jgi:hypothetical protein
MTGWRLAPRLALFAATGLACGIVLTGTVHAQDDPTALKADLERLYQAGKYPEATEITKRLLAQGADDLATLNVKVEQLFEIGKYSEALPVAILAVQTTEKQHGSEHPALTERLLMLAEILGRLGRVPEGELLERRG